MGGNIGRRRFRRLSACQKITKAFRADAMRGFDQHLSGEILHRQQGVFHMHPLIGPQRDSPAPGAYFQCPVTADGRVF